MKVFALKKTMGEIGNGLTLNKIESIETILKNPELSSYEKIAKIFGMGIVFSIDPLEQTAESYIENLKKKGYVEIPTFSYRDVGLRKEKFKTDEPAFCLVIDRRIKYEIYS